MATSSERARRAAKRSRASQRAGFVSGRAGEFDQRALDAAMARTLARPERGSGPAPRAFPTGDVSRWVPIGPAVVRRGQAEGRPRVTGRIRDIAVDGAGRRAYAASAKGGVWYTEDAGSTWSPVGGWAERPRTLGGDVNAQTCGCLLVSFGADASTDVVLVGTGETVPGRSETGGTQGGVGVLAGIGPARAPVGAGPWEAESGIATMEGLGVYRLARRPGATPGSSVGAAPDQVLAATSAGLFLGTRTRVPGPPAHDEYRWTPTAGIDALVNGAPPPTPPPAAVTDVLWLPHPLVPNGRIVVAAMDPTGGNPSVVAFSDDLGVTFAPVTGLGAATGLLGRASLAEVPGTGRLYVLGEVPGSPPPASPPPVPTLWQVPTVAPTPPAPTAPVATPVPGLPSSADLWSFDTATGTTQRDYDQAIAAESVAGTDRVFIGGSTVAPISQWSASLWAYDIGGTALAPTAGAATGLSRTGAPPGGDGADQPGLVGNTVHPDVHTITITGSAAARQVWVGCDGGVFVSTRGGRVNTFASRAVGLAALEVGFVATHPTSSHFAAAGCQDNGTQVRVGESVWEATFLGDGGGTVFHPVYSQFILAQYINASWNAQPTRGYADPMLRDRGGPAGTIGREDAAAAFYSGAAAVPRTATAGRVALGTDRVWLTDDLGIADPCTWRVLPATSGAATDPRPGGSDAAARRAIGVPGTGLGPVHTVRWASPTDLLALYQSGVMRYVQQPNGQWTVTEVMPGTPPTAGAPNPATTTLTDIAPVPGSSDFYLTTAGELTSAAGGAPVAAVDTCWFYDAGTNTFTATGLRQALDAPGPPVVAGPNDPAYAVVVDPTSTTTVYVGTVTGVWRGVRDTGTGAHVWAPFVNGLPQATVQDLAVWADPAGAGSPVLLRAAVQSRGVFEVDLANPEPSRTYLRVHEHDDRRRFPTPLANPRRRPGAPEEPVTASPDIVIRPRWPQAAAPTWQLGSGSIRASNVPAYQLWTFQTAFRWLYPSISADGRWSDQLGDLVALHRSTLGLSAGRHIDRTLWDRVVGGTRLGQPSPGTLTVSADVADPLAVYRPPWHTSAASTVAATEIDLMESVRPVRQVGDEWQVYREPCTVEVLLHHRDTRPLATGDAWAALLWRSDAQARTLTDADLSGLPGLAGTWTSAAPGAPPAGWTLAPHPTGGAVHPLPVGLDARMPRSVPIDVDLSAVPNDHRVLFVALVGSSVDPPTSAVAGAPTTATDLVRAWPYAALRLIRVVARPA